MLTNEYIIGQPDFYTNKIVSSSDGDRKSIFGGKCGFGVKADDIWHIDPDLNILKHTFNVNLQ